MLVEIKVYRNVMVMKNAVLFLLVDKNSGSKFPVCIDPVTAGAISAVMDGNEPSRPLTHNLLKSFLVDDCHIIVTKAVITRVDEKGNFYALIHYNKDGEERTKDSRPSDAIALAMLFNSPVFVEGDLWLRCMDSPGTQRTLETFAVAERRSLSDPDTDRTED